VDWESDSIPWIRQQTHKTAVHCYFCGDKTAILSFTDKSHDTGRLEVYRDN
jgi:hypothetical protein